MQFVKAHWISLLCGVVGLAAIAVAVLGMMQDTVVQEMQNRANKASEIRRLRGNPQNEETIEAERRRGAEFEAKYTETLERAARHNRREPLLPGVFPDPGQTAKRYLFKEEYGKRVKLLPSEMNAGDLPSEREMQDEQEILNDIARRKAEQEAEVASEGAAPEFPRDGGGGQPGITMGGRGGGRMAGGGGRMAGGGGRMAGGGGGRAPETPVGRTGAGDDVGSTQVTAEAVDRAKVRKARNIPVYASESSFHISPIYGQTEPPTPAQMWYAQVTLWIQEDVARAIKKVNDLAMERLEPSQQNVAHVPVKRLIQVSVDGYLTETGAFVRIPALVPALLPRSTAGTDSFTGRRSDEQFDVIQFTVTVIMDQRDINQLVDAVSTQNFYQLIGLSFETEPPDNVREDGYYYGGEPIVRATLTFEGYFARKEYKEMMPREVLVNLGIVQDGEGG